jgi:transposase
VIADGAGRAIAFRIAPGQAHGSPQAVPLLERLPGVPRWVVADRGYTSHRFRQHVWDLGARPAIPPQRHEAPVACPGWIHHHRNRVERLWSRLKGWRAVATRCEKTARSFMGVLCLAAALDWLRRQRTLVEFRPRRYTRLGCRGNPGRTAAPARPGGRAEFRN